MYPILINKKGIRDHHMNAHGQTMGANYIYRRNPIGYINIGVIMLSECRRRNGRNRQGSRSPNNYKKVFYFV